MEDWVEELRESCWNVEQKDPYLLQGTASPGHGKSVKAVHKSKSCQS